MGWIKSPIEPEDSIIIRSGLAGGQYYIAEVTENVHPTPDLLPSDIAFITPYITRSTDVVSMKVDWTIYVELTSNSLSKDGIMIMTLPDDIVYYMGEQITAVLVSNDTIEIGGSNTQYPSGAIKTMTFTGLCGVAGCPQGTQLTIKASWLKNPPVKKALPTDTISIASATDEGWVIGEGKSSQVNNLLPAITIAPISKVTIKPKIPTISKSTNYDMIFTTDADIPKDSYAVITLPNNVRISSTNTGGSSTFDSCGDLFTTTKSITCTIGTSDTGKTTVKVEGLFPEDSNSRRFGVDMGLLLNPSTTGNTGAFILNLFSRNNDPIADSADTTAIINGEVDDEDCLPNCETCSNDETS